MTDMKDELIEGAERLGIILGEDACAKFSRYAEFLGEENKRMNLTAVEGEREITERHFLDSLAVLGAAGPAASGSRIVDVGSGPGFPGVPIKIAEPSIRLTAIDSTEKKVEFLKDLFAELELDGSAVHGRAEELALLPAHREKYDFAVSRALARLNTLCELCLPFVKVGGAFLAMKTVEGEEELLEAEGAIKTLGGGVESFFDYELQGARRRIIVIRKLELTASKYPRRFAKIQKKPL
jgi:16S rRNA (guanine527-N7)-methyltransferase